MREQNVTISASVVAPKVHSQKANRQIYWVSLTRVDSDDFSSVKAAPSTDYATWLKEMLLVRDELERVRLLNSVAIARNREITKENRKQPDHSLRNGLLPMPFSPDKWIRPFILREEHHGSALSRKTPEAWKADIETIGDIEVRAAVASIVWWDYFGHISASDRHSQLDRYLNRPYVRIDNEILKRGLYQAGYSPWHAHRRLSASGIDYSQAITITGKAGQPKRHCKVNKVFHNCVKKS